MSRKILGFYVLCFFHIYVTSKKIRTPSYIKPCSISAPDFEDCCLSHGKEALPYILKGDRRFGIPNMIPLTIPQIDVDAGNNLKILLKNIEVFGLDKTILNKVKFDTDAKKLMINISIPQLSLRGNYEIDGRILILPIRGNGDLDILAIDGIYQYNAEYIISKYKGDDYFDLTEKDTLDFDLKNMKIKLNNLFDGDKKLGDQMNKFLNENWKEVLSEFGPAISGTVRSIGRSIASAIFKKIPYHELVLD
ncbi:circadian clock-controlled protein daywake-like [Diorhabda carinulata]|uniref:circadian clock-controlled protein daywake-like n=1 Tax=Diorhabda carinulata TaxID=1163345 RepID=UPI0025A28496|nr:circadian clock-controlled protein daywake-like [Diorhabda carinulata]